MYQFTYYPTPKNTLLDLMGVHKDYSLETSQLNLISEAFDISINNLRVTLNRLVSVGLVTNNERGVYSLSEKALAKRRFINRWRGELLQVEQWQGRWWACHLPKGCHRTRRKKSLQALERYGFKAGLEHMWVRPKNLNFTSTELSAALFELGLESGAYCFVVDEVPESLSAHWQSSLWNVGALDAEYENLTKQLQVSQASLENKSVSASLTETCRLGGEAIHRLAIDPLLPQQIRPGSKYLELKQSMIDYDKVGREIWLEQLQQLGVS